MGDAGFGIWNRTDQGRRSLGKAGELRTRPGLVNINTTQWLCLQDHWPYLLWVAPA
jgi:hypothetical protein